MKQIGATIQTIQGQRLKKKPHNQEAQSSKDNAASQHEKQQCANLKQGHQSRLCPTLIGLAPGQLSRQGHPLSYSTR